MALPNMKRKDYEMKRKIKSKYQVVTSDKAMTERAIKPQMRADRSPEYPLGYNLENPDPEYVFYRDKDGELKRKKKGDS